MDPRTNVKNIPEVGKPVVFKVGPQTRADLEYLTRYLADFTGKEKPLTVSEVCRACIRLVASRHRDYQSAALKKVATQGRDEL